MEAYIRIQWTKISKFYQYVYLSNFDNICKYEPEKLGFFCQFATRFLNGIDRQITDGTFAETIDAMHEKFIKEGKIFTKADMYVHYKRDRDINFALLNNFYKSRSRMLKEKYYNFNLVKYYMHLALLETLQAKTRNANLNVMKKFLNLTSEPFTPSVTDNINDCILESPVSDHIESPPLHYSVREEDMSMANQLWVTSIAPITIQIQLNDKYINCIKDNVFFHLYTLFFKLVYLQAFDFSKNKHTYIAMLLSQNAKSNFPPETSNAYVKEINQQLKVFMQNQFQTDTPYGLQDLMDMMTTTGIYSMKEKATYNKHISARKQLKADLNYSSSAKLTHIDYYPSIQQWTSLSPEDEKCFENVDVRANFSTVCTHYPDCTEYCKKIDKVLQTTSRIVWQKIMSDINHPAVFKPADSRSRPLTWLIPFCFHGRGLYSMFNQLSPGQNVNFSKNQLHYGYSFCNNAKQTITDEGVCTTFNSPDYSQLYSESMNVLERSHDQSYNWKEIYPEETISRTYEEGILLVLDSWTFEGFYRRNRDESLLLNGRETSLESFESNNYKIILHDKNEVPNFKSYETTVIPLVEPARSLNEMQMTVDSVKAYKVRIDAEVRDAEENVRSKTVAKRNCKFHDEISDLVFFKVYSRQNCLFECKIKIAARTCGCTPWNFPASNNENICNIFGNICFEKELLRLQREIWSLGSPPCGCYPSCRGIKYKTVDEKPRFQFLNYEWLDLQHQILGYITMSKQLRNNITVWEKYANDKKANQFLFNYVSDIFRLNGSLLNPGRYPLTDLIISHSWQDLIAKKKTLEGRARNLALLYIDFDKKEYALRKLRIR